MPCILLIKRNTNINVPDDGGQWKRGEIVGVYEYIDDGDPETPLPDAGLQSGQLDVNQFLRFYLNDKTAAQMQSYLDRYNRDYEFTLLGQQGDLRHFEVKNLYANNQGLGYWTLEVVAEIKSRWEAKYPAADITTIGFPNEDLNGLGNIWDMSGEFPAGQGAEFQLTVHEAGQAVLDKRKIWYVSQAMMSAITNNGGALEGNTSQLEPNLKDARLD